MINRSGVSIKNVAKSGKLFLLERVEVTQKLCIVLLKSCYISPRHDTPDTMNENETKTKFMRAKPRA